MNTLSIVTPTLSPGPQQLILINPDGESRLSMQPFSRNNFS
jgi:hypothetical protein